MSEHEELCARLTAGDSEISDDPAPAQEILDRLTRDEALRADALEDRRTDGLLRALLRAQDSGDLFARQFVARLSADDDGNEFVKAVRLRLDQVDGAAPPPRWRRKRVWQVSVPVIAVLAVVLVARFWSWRPDVVVRGDYRLFRAGEVVAGAAPRRGDRLVAGPGGAVVDLGGFCHLQLDPATDVTLAGRKGSEAIALASGRVVAQVTPHHGRFRIDTPIGPVRVVGTEFATSVQPALPPRRPFPEVRVAVTRGRVACQFGAQERLLSPGQSETFADTPPTHAADGTIVATDAGSIEIQAGAARFSVILLRPGDQLARAPSQPQVGDPVTVTWIEKDGTNLVTGVRGHLVGRITQVDRYTIDVAVPGSPARRFGARWFGNNPEDGGGPDAPMMDLIGRQRVGDRVEVSWTLVEGTRLLDISPAD